MNYLTTRRPMRNPFNLQSVFSDLFGSYENETDMGNTSWMPTVDVSETEAGFEVRAELPGVAKDDLHISIKDNLLTLSGEKRQEKVGDAHNYHRVERRYGSFQRKFALPREVETDEIKAEFNEGVLTLSIPKPEAAKPIVVPIETTS